MYVPLSKLLKTFEVELEDWRMPLKVTSQLVPGGKPVSVKVTENVAEKVNVSVIGAPLTVRLPTNVFAVVYPEGRGTE